MDKLILGLLMLSSRTIYQLRDRINKGLNLMYSSSMGSIQASIKKLLDLSYVTYEEFVENGKYKKEYSITKLGRENFYEWINSPIEETGVKIPELTKIYFMGLGEKEFRKKTIEKHLDFFKEQYKILKIICEEDENIEIAEEEKEIYKYQLLTAKYGRDLMKFNINWYGKLLSQMKKG